MPKANSGSTSPVTLKGLTSAARTITPSRFSGFGLSLVVGGGFLIYLAVINETATSWIERHLQPTNVKLTPRKWGQPSNDSYVPVPGNPGLVQPPGTPPQAPSNPLPPGEDIPIVPNPNKPIVYVPTAPTAPVATAVPNPKPPTSVPSMQTHLFAYQRGNLF